eukprot:s97_g19.t1
MRLPIKYASAAVSKQAGQPARPLVIAGDVTGRASLTKLVDGLASKACPKRAPAGELVLAEEQALAPSTETSSAGQPVTDG